MNLTVCVGVCVCAHVTFTQASPRLGVASVAFTGVRSLCVDAIPILALVGHGALINVCQFE